MAQTRITVKPQEPTVLKTENSVKLPGFELWMNYIENVLVIPTRIDVLRFTDTLSNALKLYPHAAGRLHRHEDEWEIVLLNSAVPVEVAEGKGASVGIDNDWVIQRNLRQFFATKGGGPTQTSPPADEETRLLLFKITLAMDETAIGVSWHHTLGDATVLQRFMHHLSELYQGHDIAHLPVPTFQKRSFQVPTPSLIERYSPLMPHLTNTCPTSELGQRYAEMNGDTSWVSFKVSQDQLQELKRRVTEALGHTDTMLSAQDVLTAYIVRTLNRYLNTPITDITNAASYRNVSSVVQSTNVAGNAIYIIPTSLEKASGSLSDIALAIRRSIRHCRDTIFVEEYMALASSLMLSTANNDHSLLFTATPGKLSVNSNASINWRSAHFGYPDSMRFYTSGLNDRYVRVFRSNPTRVANTQPSDKAYLAGDSLDVFFAVASNIRDRVAETIQSDLQDPNFPYNIDVTSGDGPSAENLA